MSETTKAENDTEVIASFIKVEQQSSKLRILVCSISWESSHEPTSNWEVAAVLPLKSLPGEIDSKIQEILQDQQYFKVCQECLQRNPCGWMHNHSICQGCAEKNHGVIY